MLTWKRIIVFAGFISLSSLFDVAIPTLAQAQTAPYLDANGWTVFTPSSDTRTVYVSSSAGSDSNSGLSASTPVKTIARGLSLLRNGYPDWLLLNKGDAWNESTTVCTSGRSATEPMLISSYGTGARSLIKVATSSGPGIQSTGGGGCGAGGNYLALVGIEFYAYDRDPNSSDFNASTVDSYLSGTAFFNPISWMLIENCKFSFFDVNIDIDGSYFPQNLSNISIRRNVVVDAYGISYHSQGAYMNDVNNLLLEENLFDHNGWNSTVPGAGANVFNHNIYLQGIGSPGNLTTMSGPATIRGNVFSNDGSGSQIRAGGIITNNLWVHNPYPHNIGMPSAFASVVSNNVYVEGVDMPSSPSVAYAQGPQTFSSYDGDAYNIGTVTFSNNIIAHTLVHSGNGFGISLDSGSQGDTVTGNILYDWQNPLIIDQGTGNTVSGNIQDASGTNSGGLPEPFPNPTLSVGSYYATLGLGGSGLLTDFLSAARLQSKDNWNPTLIAQAVNNYIRAGFVPNPVVMPTSTPNTTPPSVPTGLTGTGVSTTQVNLSWTTSTDNIGVTGYNVFRNGTKVGASSNTSYQDTGLSAGTTYTYTASAYDAAGNTSAQSSGVSVTTQAAAPAPPPPPPLGAPSVTISSPKNGAKIVNSNVNITTSASLAGGIASITIIVDGKPLATCTNTTACAAIWNNTKISQGTHSIVATATSNNGLLSSATVSILALR
jgi:chitodextrinase